MLGRFSEGKSEELAPQVLMALHAAKLEAEFLIVSSCVSSRMALRLKDRVKPNRRARGSSGCGTPLITSILLHPAATEQKK